MSSLTEPANQSARFDWKPTLVVFSVAAVAAWWLAAHRFILTFDEGIYLAGAERVVRGQVPYRDFFAITGPGTFWLHAAFLKLLGPTLAHARLVLVIDLAVLSAAVYWITARLTRPSLAIGTVFFFFAFETRPLFRLYSNHRWDSSAFSMLAVALVFWGTERPRFAAFAAAGLAAAFAAWTTPSLLALVVILAVWMVLIPNLRKHLPAYALGIGICSAAAAGYLIFEGGLLPMFHDLLWTAVHYPAANRVPYGYGAIGPGPLSARYTGASLSQALARTTGLLSVILPPLLPLGIYALWLVRRWRTRRFTQREALATLLVIASFALVISTYPRWSADQLLFIAPVFYVLAAYLLDQFLQARVPRAVAFGFLLAMGTAAMAYTVLQIHSEPVFQSRVGPLRALPADQAFVKFATQRIRPGDSLFVYPYLPIVYFLTGARNPTPYSFLQPGMMGDQLDSKAVGSLREHPPKWVFYFKIPPVTFHGIWPGAKPRSLAENAVDRYIRAHYRPVVVLRHPVTEFYLMERAK